MDGGGGGGSEYIMLLCILPEQRIQNIECIIQNIKLTMYLFFYMALGHNDFDAGKLLANGTRFPCSIQGPKKV
jgi:hypothetical protein